MDFVQEQIRNIKAGETYNYGIWRQFSNVTQDLHSITLRWCILVDGQFTHTIFADSDWDGCQVENCTFNKLSFENSDITSTYFKSCKFFDVNFKGATTTDITFEDCTFEDCTFDHIGLNSSTFKSCIFIKLKSRQSSTTLNKFENCYFEKSHISGNFLYNIFIDSHFKDSIISEHLIASNFGFSATNFIELSFDLQNIKTYQQECLDRKDIIAAAIIALNIEKKFYDYSILTSAQVIVNQLKNGILVRTEQILFLKLIIEYMLISEQISLYTVIQIISILEKIKTLKNNIAIKKSKSVIHQIYGLLFDYYHQMIIHIDKELVELTYEQNPMLIKITYKEEPLIPICSLVEQMMYSLGISGPVPYRERTEIGSFIEWIQGYDNILKCLQLLISILGLGVSLKNAHHKTPESNENKASSQTSDKCNCSSDNTSNSVVFEIPESILSQLSTVQTEQDISKSINIFVLNGVNINNNFKGYNNFNVEKIEIL